MIPRSKRLNGWQRIGIVLSVLWAIGGAFWGYNMGYYEGGDIDRDFQQCRAGAQNWYENQGQYQQTRRYTTNDLIKNLAKCADQYQKAHKDAEQTGMLYAALLAVLPIPLSWFAIYKSIILLRWIREGFET